MRINVDDVALRDQDINRRLPRFTGLGRFDAFGRLIHVWGLAYDTRSADLLIEDVDDRAEHQGFADAMVRAGLADVVSDDVVRVRGVEKRIGYLLRQAELGARGGGKRAREGTRGAAGQFAKGSTKGAPSEPLDESRGQPSEPLDDDQGKSKPTSCSGSTPPPALAPIEQTGFALSGDQPTRARKKPAPKAPAVESSLPDDWTPTAEHVARASASGLVLSREAELFRARCADKSRTSACWDGAFTTWLIRAPDFQRGPVTGQSPSTITKPKKVLT